jgi:hypothetical protein
LHLTAFGVGIQRAICQFSCYYQIGILPESVAGEPHRWCAKLTWCF